MSKHLGEIVFVIMFFSLNFSCFQFDTAGQLPEMSSEKEQFISNNEITLPNKENVRAIVLPIEYLENDKLSFRDGNYERLKYTKFVINKVNISITGHFSSKDSVYSTWDLERYVGLTIIFSLCCMVCCTQVPNQSNMKSLCDQILGEWGIIYIGNTTCNTCPDISFFENLKCQFV